MDSIRNLFKIQIQKARGTTNGGHSETAKCQLLKFGHLTVSDYTPQDWEVVWTKLKTLEGQDDVRRQGVLWLKTQLDR